MIALLTSCVAPRDKKAMYADPFESEANATGSSDASDGTTGSGVTVGSGDDSSSGNNSNIPSHLQHCKWALDGETGFDKSSNSHIGAHTICQSKSNSNEVYVQIKDLGEDSNARVCVIPTYESGGNSIFLGEARCQFMPNNKEIYRFPLIKNRDYGKYQNFPVNSVMVMKEKTYFFESPYYREQITYDAFFICSVNLDLHRDSTYCDTFKTKGEYVYKKF